MKFIFLNINLDFAFTEMAWNAYEGDFIFCLMWAIPCGITSYALKQ
jgi:hypothetical protein